jgi:hypothetical protein
MLLTSIRYQRLRIACSLTHQESYPLNASVVEVAVWRTVVLGCE